MQTQQVDWATGGRWSACYALLLSITMALLATGFQLESHGKWFWLVHSFWLTCWAFAEGRFSSNLLWAKAIGGLFAYLASIALLGAQVPAYQSISSPLWRTLLVAFPTLSLCSMFGLSLGVLSKHTFALQFEWFAAKRFLLAKKSSVLSVVTTLSVLGVMLGIWLILTTLAVLGGFERDLREKMIGSNAHIQIQRADHQPFPWDTQLANQILENKQVVAASPVIEAEVGIVNQQHVQNCLVLGVLPEQVKHVLNVFENIPSNLLEVTPESNPEEAMYGHQAPAIVLGIELARMLHVVPGDTIRLISPMQEILSPIGPIPKSQTYQISGVFESKMYEFDARYAYIHLEQARKLTDLSDQMIHAVQLKVQDETNVEQVTIQLDRQLARHNVQAESWRTRNATLFAALALERVVAFVVMGFIVLVASFSITNTLTLSVLEKQGEIAILKTMGSTNETIMKIFLLQGLMMGVFGSVLGLFLGLATLAALRYIGFWIPTDIYYIDTLPVAITATDVSAIMVIAFLLIWNFAMIPSFRGAQMTPVEGLRVS